MVLFGVYKGLATIAWWFRRVVKGFSRRRNY